MRTHCPQGHPVKYGGRCQSCDNATRQRRNAKKLGDGLTPQERLRKVRKGWAWCKNYLRPGGAA
jgi:hypothetical protein